MTPRALVVDASQPFRESLSNRLRDLGLEVFQAGSQKELAAMDAGPWSLVVTDWGLPGMEGRELLLRLAPGRQPVYVSTDRDLDEVREPARALGAQGVFSKLRRSELVSELRILLENSQPTPRPAGAAALCFLVVEDSPSVRLYLRAALEKGFQPCRVLEAGDGRAALQELTRNRVHLIVTDLRMPGMDGEGFLQLLAKNPVLCKKPVLVFSAAITGEVAEIGAGLANIQCLAKPSDHASIAAAVRRQLQLQG
jgi:two-component system chemotaxis response regulator CheY